MKDHPPAGHEPGLELGEDPLDLVEGHGVRRVAEHEVDAGRRPGEERLDRCLGNGSTKPDRLDAAEYEEIKRHPEIGARILEPVEFLRSVVPCVRHHHEWYDGCSSGYPDRLAGDQIPLPSRVIVVADVRAGSPTEGAHVRTMLGDGRAMLVRIPPGVAHGCRNLGSAPATILYFADVQFSADPGECDEGRLPWDWVGKDVWDVAWD